MKSLLLAALLAVSGSAFAADLSSVGTTGAEATADYSYARTQNTKAYVAAHEAEVGVQLNAGGLGSVALEAGDTQLVTNYRLNFPTFTAGYANAVKLGELNLVAGLSYSALTGDRWFPLARGKNGSARTDVAAGVVEANFPVNFVLTHYLVTVKPFVDYTRSYAWANDDHGSLTTNGVAIGTYADLTKNVVAKVGYTRDWTWADHSQGVLASLSYKF